MSISSRTTRISALLLVAAMLMAVPTANGQGQSGTTLYAVKTATGIWTQTYSWTIEKSVVGPAPLCVGTEGDVTYTIVATKGDMTEQRGVSGTITVTNGGDVATENLTLVDQVQYKIGSGQFQDLAGATQTIIPAVQLGPGEAGTYDYQIEFTPIADAQYRNTVKVTITNHSGHLGDLFGPEPKADFVPPTTPIVVNDSVQVADNETIPEGLTLVGSTEPTWPQTVSATTTFEFTKTVKSAAAGDYQIDDTATATGDDGVVLASAEGSATVTVKLCGCTISGAKFYDADADGQWDSTSTPAELGLEGWKIHLTGTDELGNPVDLETFTGQDGTFKFENLLPGHYTVEEVFPPSPPTWVPTTATSFDCDPVAGEDYVGPDFGNVCLEVGQGGLTLGYWSNKNGQALITSADVTSLNGLNLFTPTGWLYPPFATAPQIKNYLLSATAVDMRWMLSAQLIATELDVLHSFLSGATIVYVGPSTYVPGGFITIAQIMANANTALGKPHPEFRAEQEYWKRALDDVNNNRLPFVCGSPCPVIYPTISE